MQQHNYYPYYLVVLMTIIVKTKYYETANRYGVRFDIRCIVWITACYESDGVKSFAAALYKAKSPCTIVPDVGPMPLYPLFQ